jgi:hypothetical protein
MIKIAIAAALVAAFAGTAAAQERLRANERYCLETTDGGPDGGGTSPLMCRFETLAQCIASKTAQADRCMLNPRLAMPPPR